MKVLTAKDYGYRKVVRVLINDQDPQWVHDDGTPDIGHTGDTADPDQTKVVCGDCRNNWNVFEAQFDGDALLKEVKISPAVEGVRGVTAVAAVKAVKAVEADPDNNIEAVEAVAAIRAVVGIKAVAAKEVVTEMQPKTDAEIIAEALARAEASIPTVREMIPAAIDAIDIEL
jgi:hypothetical protein